MTHEQGSISGNLAAINDIIFNELGYSEDDLAKMILPVSGDQLTMDRLRSIEHLLSHDLVGARHNGMLRMLGLFHMMMNYLAMLMKNHLGDAKDPSSLLSMNAILGRKGICAKADPFWEHKDFIFHTLDGMVIAAIMEALRVKDWDDFEALLGDGSQANAVGWHQAVEDFAAKLQYNQVELMRQGSDDTRDVSKENALLLVRHCMAFRAVYQAGRNADAGQLEYWLELLTPQFLGGGADKYSKEMLELQCCLKAEFSPELKEIVLRNFTMNALGTHGDCAFRDEQQERLVRAIKDIGSGGSGQWSEYARETITVAIWQITQIKKVMEQTTIGRIKGGRHIRRSAEADVRLLVERMVGARLFGHINGRGLEEGGHGQSFKQVQDWMTKGKADLRDGRKWDKFLKQSLRSMGGDGPQADLHNVDEGDVDEEDAEEEGGNFIGDIVDIER
jgi:hypothetical protein